MNTIGERIQDLRKQLSISQQDLSIRAEVSKSMINRYETKGVQPPADILNRIATILNTSVDYLINGTGDEKAKATLKSTELLTKFKDIENLPEKEQSVILEVISAYIRDYKAKKAYAS
jgi:transcriptional regulator with XRE-family HTH domain